MAIEKPTYQLLRKDGRFELRLYDPYITAEVTVIADNARQAASIGFSPLGGYIFGNNTSRKKIAMTAPVAAQSCSEKIAMTAPVAVTDAGAYTVSFTMPSKYTLTSLPIPNDERVQLVEHPSQTFAAVRFSGPFQQPNFDKHIRKLCAWLAENHLQPAGGPVIAGYNAPITPNFLKHNEILIPLI
jgi:effector-binding domain-containing protein